MTKIYLIPSLLDETAKDSLPASVLAAVMDCQCFFVENERSARRFLKSIWKEMVIDDYEWWMADKSTIRNNEIRTAFINAIRANKNIGIISEAGCPGVADPGQLLVEIAHSQHCQVIPLVGPSSILLALMASGMNGQQFRFVGYLPIETAARIKALKEMEIDSVKNNCTQIFMETPYRNNQLMETLMKNCRPETKLCVAANLTGEKEFIRTMQIKQWKQEMPDLHKQPVMFLLTAGN